MLEVYSLKMHKVIHLLTLLSGITLVKTQIDLPVNFEVTEQEESDSFIGSIPQSSGILSSVPPADSEILRYDFLNQNDVTVSKLFRITESSGDLYTNSVIDREDVCAFRVVCAIEFDVAIRSDGSYFQIITVIVTVTDINDNSPAFPNTEEVLVIPEGVAVGTEYSVPIATDLDMGPLNGVKSYSILPENGTFDLSMHRLSDGSFDVNIVVNAKLDRESEESYQVFVVAKDGGVPQNKGMLAVNISILDTNDNKPVFSKDIYNITVTETTDVDSIIAVPTVSDADSGENAQLTFSFGPQVSEAVKKLFQINSKSGHISVVSSLTYKAGIGYRLPIEVKDGGTPALSSQSIVQVNILDTTNNPPVIKVNLLSPGLVGVVNIAENSGIEDFVAHVSVTDSDTGSNGYVVCRLNDDTFMLQTVKGRGYKVVVNGQLDREKQDSYNVIITCQDQGSPPLSAIKSFRVQLTDVNDNPPVFSQNLYSASIEENNDIGQVIVLVSATDMDLGNNTNVNFKLVNSDYSSMFAFSQDGLVVANSPFDRETTSKIRLEILACDSGCSSSSLTATATITVDILDQNDCSPEITEPVSTSPPYMLYENRPSDLTVKTLLAEDKDMGENGTVIFSIPDDMQSQLPFVLFKDGILKTNRELDRELQSRYDFNVEARDMGQPPKRSYARVTVIVLDENDNAPIVTFPNNTNNTVTVSYHTTSAKPVTRVEAYDVDEGKNSVLSYSILNGNTDIFKINKSTGDIYYAHKVNIKVDQKYTLEVLVKDQGETSLETTSTLNIVLKYANESSVQTLKKDKENKNLIVIVAVCVVTLVIAAVIVSVIFLIRRGDRVKNKHNAENGSSCGIAKEIGAKDHTGYQQTFDAAFDENKKKERKVSFCMDNIHKEPQQRSYDPPAYDKLSSSNIIMPLPGNPGLSMANAKLALTNADGCMDDSTSDSGRGGSEDDIQLPGHRDSLKYSHTSRSRSPMCSLDGQLDLSFHNTPCSSPKRMNSKEDCLPHEKDSRRDINYNRQTSLGSFQNNPSSRSKSSSPARRLSGPHRPHKKFINPPTGSELSPRAQFERSRSRTPEGFGRSRTPDNYLGSKALCNSRNSSVDQPLRTFTPVHHMTYLTDSDPEFNGRKVVKFNPPKDPNARDLIV